MISIQGPGLKQRGIAPLISCGHQWPLHINGDQHLTTLCQYGTKQQRDSNCSFCTLAISAGYPRWWLSDEVGKPPQNRPAHGHTNTGEYLDGFGNKVYVDAVGNPVVGKAPNRYDKAHEKGSGFGFMTCDTVEKVCARFLSLPCRCHGWQSLESISWIPGHDSPRGESRRKSLSSDLSNQCPGDDVARGR